MVVSREETQEKMNRQIFGASKNKPSQTYTVADRYEQFAAEKPNAPAVRWHNREWSYESLNDRANQMAVTFHSLGLERGDTVAFLMDNRPEFYIAVLGLAKLGVVASLINTQQKGDRLAHSIERVPPKAIVTGSECLAHLKDSYPRAAAPVWVIGDEEFPASAADLDGYAKDITPLIDASDAGAYDKGWREGLTAGDMFVYIFTSGTTGLPKAAKLSHVRWLNTGDGMSALLEFRPDDVFYCVLPLYHSAGFMSLTSMCLAVGGCMALRRKFSVSNFWSDVRTHKITVTQYIGEMCRYLIAQPEQPDDADNPLRAMIGSSIGMDIWDRFKTRFDVEQIFEGWGSTEANTGMTNVDQKIGAVGRVPNKQMSNIRLIKYDLEADEHVRNEEGLCIETDDDEVGELVAMILDLPDSAAGRFEGYSDPAETEKKILRNVLQPGDAFFRSGDLFRRDADDYFYFIDRVGDTFRWKSENVSTMEVAETLADFDGLAFVNCYGVKVPGTEGRAGMIAVTLKEGASFDPKAFYAFATERLAHYAVPLFVRITANMDMTATMKMRKVDFQRAGYDPARVDGDALFVKVDADQAYAPLSDETLEKAGLAPFEGE